jgi:hypothetical protein
VHADGFADDTLGELFVDLFVDRVEAVVLRAREFERRFGEKDRGARKRVSMISLSSLSLSYTSYRYESLRNEKQAP